MSERSPLFSWAKYTPPVRFTGTGTQSFGVFRVGQNTRLNFLVLEAHYHHLLSSPDTTTGITIHITRSLNTNPPAKYNKIYLY